MKIHFNHASISSLQWKLLREAKPKMRIFSDNHKTGSYSSYPKNKRIHFTSTWYTFDKHYIFSSSLRYISSLSCVNIFNICCENLYIRRTKYDAYSKYKVSIVFSSTSMLFLCAEDIITTMIRTWLTSHTTTHFSLVACGSKKKSRTWHRDFQRPSYTPCVCKVPNH